MPDRSLRLLTFPPRPAQGGERGAALLRERPTSPPTESPRGGSGQGGAGRSGSGHGGSGQGGSGNGGSGAGGERQDDNPFAPPPEGAPDQPWWPRHHGGPSGPGQGHGQAPGSGHGGHGPGHGPGPGQGQAPGQGPGDGQGPGGHAPWGSQWSDRQPGRSPGGFGERPGGGPQGPGGPVGPGMRWDPTDPAQRRARYALLSGMWAVFFALFSWPYVALLLGALSLYWGISALRAKPRRPSPDAPATPTAPSAPAGRPQTTAAVGGLVTAGLALVLVASTFTVQLVYRDYYTCVNDALTHEAKQSCNTLLPRELRGVLGTENS
ncbi:hypothetical protein [Streptomyces sp. NRRL WC-3744]|uniref:hypothetical protein n=1 Tax=Streptomyces sp. NRRL WC-3744 TaxID=1463935 RepID=UPI000996BAA5|nr:hypothetical protein [Streptomyces sp. NRRL WC-3744]